MRAMRPLRALATAATLLACFLPFSRACAAASPREASELLGTTVVDARGKRLGALTDFVVDMGKEQIVGVQVGHSTADGMANEVFSLPGVQLGDGKFIIRPGNASMAGEAPAEQSLAKMIHAPLRDAAGKAAGEISDVMVNFEEARVTAIVIRFDPKWLDMAAPAAVAPSSLERKDDGYLVKFSASDVRPSAPAGPKTGAAPPPPPLPPRARLTQAPADALAKIPAANLSTARRMLGATIVDPSGKPVGKVEDVVIELSDGSAKFIVASFDPSWVASGWLVAMKMRPIEAGANGQAQVKANLNEINFAFLFQAASWPDFSDPAAREMIRAKLGV